MRIVCILFFLEFIIIGKSNAQNVTHLNSYNDTTQIIKKIKDSYAEFHRREKTYQVLEKALSGETTEGGFIAAYYDKKNPQMIAATYYKETGKVIEECYFKQNTLYFVFLKEYLYNEPIYNKGSKVVSIRENRYYFNKESMLKWVSNKTVKSPNSKGFEKEAANISDDAKMLLNSIVYCEINKANAIHNTDTLRCMYGSDCPSTGYVLKNSRNSCGAVIHVASLNKNVPLEK